MDSRGDGRGPLANGDLIGPRCQEERCQGNPHFHLSKSSVSPYNIDFISIISPYFQIKTNTVVQNISKTECKRQWIQVMTSLGQFTGRVVINCGGLYGDIVDKLAGLQHFRYIKHMFLSYTLPS